MGAVTSAAIVVLDVVDASVGHAVLVAAIATPYLAFALLDATLRSLVAETVLVVLFVAASLILLNASAWLVAVALAAHGVWDLAHVRWAITEHTGNYPQWCAAFDVTAAAGLVVSHLIS